MYENATLDINAIREAIERAEIVKDESPWARAVEVGPFLAGGDDTVAWRVRELLAPESITVLASPRGLGKTQVALKLAVELCGGGIFRGQKLEACRVLYLDRENPKAVLRRRFRKWGATEETPALRLLARDDCPTLTNSKAWASFPYSDYDVVVLDSISAATEGVKEGDGGQTGAAIAPLLNVSAKGVAVLVLANTKKTGEAIRGCGVISDRASVIYELRDATDLKLDPKRETWWECLPEASEGPWGARAKRRAPREIFRLAFIISKCRLDVEPQPFVLELRMPEDGTWAIADVTGEVEAEHTRLKGEANDECRAREKEAVEALKAALPILKNPDAIDLLTREGLSRDRARELIADRAGHEWLLSGGGRKSDPVKLLCIEPTAGISRIDGPTGPSSREQSIPAGFGAQGPQEMTFKNRCPTEVSHTGNSCGASSSEGEREEIEL